jgi:hypothetical protein
MSSYRRPIVETPLRALGPKLKLGSIHRAATLYGFTAEIVVGALEDAEDYEAFEAGIIADYDAQSAFECDLVLRLASILWRLRRATTHGNRLSEIQLNIA